MSTLAFAITVYRRPAFLWSASTEPRSSPGTRDDPANPRQSMHGYYRLTYRESFETCSKSARVPSSEVFLAVRQLQYRHPEVVRKTNSSRVRRIESRF